MKDGPIIAEIAALIGDPARANMLGALMDGRALTVSELAQAAGVALPTASGHLARLDAAGLLKVERQGRHRYHRLSGSDVAEVIEALMGLAQRTGARRVRTGPSDAALREARICYDHLAGDRGVKLLHALVQLGWVSDRGDLTLTGVGRERLAAIGIDLSGASRRPVCRACLDWSERRIHLGGRLGAALFDLMLVKGWAARDRGRVIRFSRRGERALAEAIPGAA